MEVPSVVLDGMCYLGELENSSFANVVDGVYDTLSGKTTTQVNYCDCLQSAVLTSRQLG